MEHRDQREGNHQDEEEETVAGQPRRLRSMCPRPCYCRGRSVVDWDERPLRTVPTIDALGAGRGRRARATDVLPTADGSVAASSVCARGPDVREARRDRVNFVRDKYPGRAFRRCDPRFADDSSPDGLFDIVDGGHGGCRIRVGRRSGRNLGGCVDRSGGARLRRRGGRSGAFRCDRGGSRKLFRRHLRGGILVIGRDWCRECNRRRAGGRADRR